MVLDIYIPCSDLPSAYCMSHCINVQCIDTISALEIIEPEAEVVDSICSGNARTVNPPRPVTLSARDLRPERENQLDSAEAYR